MRLKVLLHTLLFVFIAAFIAKAQKNPYKDIGKKAEVLTLTNGKYEEFFDDEDVQQIGTALINIRTNKIVKLLSKEDAEKRLDNTMGKRFLSVDPLTGKYPYLTPYQFASNRPIDGSDIDGKEWGQETVLERDFSFAAFRLVTTNYIKVKVENQSKIVTNQVDIQTKAELFKKAVEEKFTNVQSPLLLPDHIIKTEVILDYSPPTPNDGSIGHLVFTDIQSTVTTSVKQQGNQIITTKTTTFDAGITKGAINSFTIQVGVTRDGNLVSDADFMHTSQHEAGHSGGLNHPWELSSMERQQIAEFNQRGLPAIIDKNSIITNLLNSFENPDPSLRPSGNNILLKKQLDVMTQKIKQYSPYGPEDLKPAPPK